MTSTNLKNLPEGTYFTERGYSQSYPWVQIAATAKTRTLAAVNHKADPEWKPEFYAGGFAAHCANQSEQTWLYDGIDVARTITIRLNKKGQWVRGETRFTEGQARYFYDYNF